MTARLFVPTLALLVLIAAPAAAQTTATTATTTPPVNLVGTWDVMFNTTQGQYPAQVTLKKDGDRTIGTVTSQIGATPIEAEAKGSDVSLWFTFSSPQGNVEIAMNGTISGDSMKGNLVMAGDAGGDWTATRVKDKSAATTTPAAPAAAAPSAPATLDVTGAWTLNVSLGEISASPSLTLKQDGGKLSGQYTSTQYGQFPVTGTITGSDIAISCAMTIEGNAVTVQFSGTASADGTMKGSVSYGDMMSGTFTGTRQK